MQEAYWLFWSERWMITPKISPKKRATIKENRLSSRLRMLKSYCYIIGDSYIKILQNILAPK